MATDAEEQEQKPIKKEQANANNNAQKPKPDSTVILERKKAPNRLVVGANFRFLSLSRDLSDWIFFSACWSALRHFPIGVLFLSFSACMEATRNRVANNEARLFILPSSASDLVLCMFSFRSRSSYEELFKEDFYVTFRGKKRNALLKASSKKFCTSSRELSRSRAAVRDVQSKDFRIAFVLKRARESLID